MHWKLLKPIGRPRMLDFLPTKIGKKEIISPTTRTILLAGRICPFALMNDPAWLQQSKGYLHNAYNTIIGIVYSTDANLLSRVRATQLLVLRM